MFDSESGADLGEALRSMPMLENLELFSMSKGSYYQLFSLSHSFYG
jgi:hypothetical protein